MNRLIAACLCLGLLAGACSGSIGEADTNPTTMTTWATSEQAGGDSVQLPDLGASVGEPCDERGTLGFKGRHPWQTT